MSKADTWENGLMLLLFNNTAFTLVGDASGLPATATAGSLYVSLHTADPGEAGTQATSEATYTNYSRQAVARSGAGWVVTAGSVSPASTISFPVGTGGSGTVTHFGIGVSSGTGAGKLLYSGTVTPNIVTGNTITPSLTTSSTITED